MSNSAGLGTGLANCGRAFTAQRDVNMSRAESPHAQQALLPIASVLLWSVTRSSCHFLLTRPSYVVHKSDLYQPLQVILIAAGPHTSGLSLNTSNATVRVSKT